MKKKLTAALVGVVLAMGTTAAYASVIVGNNSDYHDPPNTTVVDATGTGHILVASDSLAAGNSATTISLWWKDGYWKTVNLPSSTFLRHVDINNNCVPGPDGTCEKNLDNTDQDVAITSGWSQTGNLPFAKNGQYEEVTENATGTGNVLHVSDFDHGTLTDVLVTYANGKTQHIETDVSGDSLVNDIEFVHQPLMPFLLDGDGMGP